MQVFPILDIPSESPVLDFERISDSLSSAILNAKRGPLTIGIFGNFGVGKTTLLNKVYNRTNSMKSDSVILVKFNAWRYDHEPYLFLPFLKTIQSHPQVKNKPSLTKKFQAARRAFEDAVSFEVNAGIAKMGFSADKALRTEDRLLQNGISKVISDYTDIYQELSQIVQDKDKKVKQQFVIFIDDLDRCLPRKAFKLLEQLKSLLDIEGFVFVIGLDHRAIKLYVQEKFQTETFISGEEYLEKMFQISYHLLLPNIDEINSHVSSLLEDITRQESQEASVWVNKIGIAQKRIGRFWPCNLRKIKRILNLNQMLYAVHEKEELIERLLCMQIFQVRWPCAYHYYMSNINSFSQLICSFNGNGATPTDFEGAKDGQNIMYEIKSKDFMQFYKESNIGSEQEMQLIMRFAEILSI